MIFADHVVISNLCVSGVSATAVAAAVTDWRSGRIPNQLLAASAAAALMISAFDSASLSLLQALLGGGAGLLLLLPFYLLRGMAAGDVKLMAVIGLYAGPLAITDIALVSFIVGGIFSLLILAARSPSVSWFLLGLRSLTGLGSEAATRTFPPEGRLKTKRGVYPFGVAVAIATLMMIAATWMQRTAN